MSLPGRISKWRCLPVIIHARVPTLTRPNVLGQVSHAESRETAGGRHLQLSVHEVMVGRRTVLHFSLVHHGLLLSEVLQDANLSEVGSHQHFRY